MKRTKLFCAGCLALVMVFSSLAVVEADSRTSMVPTDFVEDDKFERLGYKKHTIKFQREDELAKRISVKSLREKSEIISRKNKDNIKEIKKFIIGLNLEKSFESHLIRKLKKLDNKDSYISDYTLYIPPHTNYYGMYKNRRFRDYFVVYIDTYKVYTKNENKQRNWAKGLVDILMCFSSPILSVPYTILSNMERERVISISGDKFVYKVSEEVTEHQIFIEDIANATYVPAFLEEARVSSCFLHIYFANHASWDIVKKVMYMKPTYPKSWGHSKYSKMKRAYERYMVYPGNPIKEVQGRLKVVFD